MKKKEQQEFNQAVIYLLEELVHEVSHLSKTSIGADRNYDDLYKKLALLNGLMQP